eukprot:g1946.t1
MAGRVLERLPPKVKRTLYVRNLPFKITADEIYDIFGKFGPVRQIRVGCEKSTRGTAFVVYEDIYDAKNAVEHLSGFNVCGRYLVVLYYQATKMKERVDKKKKQKELQELRKNDRHHTMIRVNDFLENAEYDVFGTGGQKKSTMLEYVGSRWTIIVSHKSFLHPVFATELNELSRIRKEFEKRKVQIMIVATDSEESMQRLVKDAPMLFEGAPEDFSGSFEIVADASGEFSKAVRLLSPKAAEMKGTRLRRRAPEHLHPCTLVVDKFKRVRWKCTYPEHVGRNFEELIRTVDALLLVSDHEVECPHNWAKGEDVFINNDVDEKNASVMFSRGVIFIKPWLRLTPMPTERDLAFRKRAQEKERAEILSIEEAKRADNVK